MRTNMKSPFGVIKFIHPDSFIEEILFDSESEMDWALRESLRGGFDIECIAMFVHTEDVAERLAATAVKISGHRPPIYRLMD